MAQIKFILNPITGRLDAIRKAAVGVQYILTEISDFLNTEDGERMKTEASE